MTNSPDGERPDKGETLAGERPSAGAREAAAGGMETGRSPIASSGSTPGGTPSDRTAAGASPDIKTQAEPRGRRRRRRRKSAQTIAKQAAPDTGAGERVDARTDSPRPGNADAASGQSGSDNRAGDAPGKGKKGRKRRRKPARALQGRPLLSASGKPMQGQASGGAANATEAGQPAQMQRGNADQTSSGHRPQPRPPLDDLYAALDLGTNNCRLLIAQPTRPGQFRVVDAFSRIVRLGEGLAATGRLSEEAMDRAVEALRVCASKLGNRTLRLERLIATEACRSAENGAEFLARVLSETGLDLEIVNRETEARLAVAGCSSLVGRETDGLVLDRFLPYRLSVLANTVSRAIARLYAEDLHRVPELHPGIQGLLQPREEPVAVAVEEASHAELAEPPAAV